MVEEPGQDRNVAILMDFENTKDANLQRILSSAAAFGQVIIRRAYADWARHAFAQGSLREAGFEAVHQFTTGHGSKNATDIQLTVDAMDILWSRPVDVFVLVTADSDFAKLAMRLREGGKMVVGVGHKKRVGRALVQACDQYIYYQEGAKPKSRSRPGPRTQQEKGAKKAPEPAKKAETAQITNLHKVVLSSLEPAADDEGWVYGSPLHRSIKRLYPDFNYKGYGFSSFRGFIESLAPVIGTETDEDRSDFLVWIEEPYEEEAWQAVQEDSMPSDKLTLSEDVQERIGTEWEKSAKNGRLSGTQAGAVVAREYGVDKLSETPLGNLDGVLAAAPKLKSRWKREGRHLKPVQ
jgi:uncharacterized protein (TIGR00288 family)